MYTCGCIVNNHVYNVLVNAYEGSTAAAIIVYPSSIL